MKKIIRNKKSSWIVLGVAMASALLVLWVRSTVQAGNYSSEVYTAIRTPEYVTDAGRAINAYERMMDRYMDLTSRDIATLTSNSTQMAVRLDQIESRLDRILKSQAKIEKALGITSVPEVRVQEIKGQERTEKQPGKKRRLND